MDDYNPEILSNWTLLDLALLNNSTSDQKIENNRIYYENPEAMLDPTNNPVFLPILVTHIITFIVGVIGNCVVIVAWISHGKQRSPTAVFLISLAIADLLLLLIYVPLETLGYFINTWDSNGCVCKLSSYIEMLSGMASVLNLVAVSFERFLVIVHPIRARSLCTQTTSIRGLLIVWTLAILLASPVLITKNIYSITYYNNETSITAFYCWDTDDDLALVVSIYQLLSMFVMPALFMVICYFWVIQELWASTRIVAALTRPTDNLSNPTSLPSTLGILRFHCHRERETIRSSNKHSKNDNISQPNSHKQSSNVKLCRFYINARHARRQVIKMLILVVILFLLCWGPRLIMNLLIKLGIKSYTQITYTTRVGCYLLSFIHSALNPFVYGFMSTNFRRMMFHSCNSGSSAQPSSDVADHHLIACYERNRNRKFSDIYEPTGTSRTCVSTNHNVENNAIDDCV